MKKTCSKCNKPKNISQFYAKNKAKGTYQAECKKCRNSTLNSYKTGQGQHARIARYRKSIATRTGAYPFTFAKREATKRGKEWILTEPEYLALVNQNCYYCELPLGKTGVGLDRLDNRFGYSPNNVVPCCTICNNVRGDVFSVAQMKMLGKVVAKIKTMGVISSIS